MSQHRLFTTALALLFALILAAPARAQDGDDPDVPEPEVPEEVPGRSAERIQGLMTEAFDHMTAGGRMLADAAGESGPEAEAKRKQATERYEQAIDAYRQVLSGVEHLEGLPEDRKDDVRQIAYYNIACARSLQGKTDAALDAFAQALASGFDDFDHIAQDHDLDPIRDEPRFVQLLERTKARAEQEAMAAGRAALSPGASFPYDFTVTTLEGEQLSLADLRGKAVIVDYWGTWCPPCRAEIPHFIALKKEFGDRLEIVGMTWENGKGGPATEAMVKAFAKQQGMNYPLTLLTEREQLAKVPDLNAFPTTLFIDKGGRVRAKEVGYRDLRVLRSLVSALLAEEAAPEPGEGQQPPSGGSLGPF